MNGHPYTASHVTAYMLDNYKCKLLNNFTHLDTIKVAT
jgi:hypothetical protein